MGFYDSVDGVTELGSTADAKRAGDTCVAPRLGEKLVKLLSDEGIEVLVVMPKSKAVADAYSHRYLGLVPVGERGNSLVFKVLENYANPYTSILTESSKQPRRLNSLRPPTVHDPPPSGSRQSNL
jgi:cobyrinic acid a,c-diamide synthase